jgi:hypothetical protein
MSKRAIVVAVAAVVIVSLALGSTAGAARPSFNPGCLGTKIEGGASGVFAMPFGGEAGTIAIVVEETADGPVLAFDTGDASHLVTGIDVKGGTALRSYSFGDGASSAEGLHAALNPRSGKWYGISHVCVHTAPGSEQAEGAVE